MHSSPFLYFLFRLLRQLRYKPLPSFKCVYTHDLYIHEWVCETEIDLCDNRPCSTYICLHIQRMKKKREREKLTCERLEHDNKRRYNKSHPTPAFCLVLYAS
jgi:hypothetical protein